MRARGTRRRERGERKAMREKKVFFIRILVVTHYGFLEVLVPEGNQTGLIG